MNRLELMKTLSSKTDTKIVLIVIDGLGGLYSESHGKSELEAADILNLDALAKNSSCGLADPISPESLPEAPAHLGLFDMILWNLQITGVLEACGLGFHLLNEMLRQSQLLHT